MKFDLINEDFTFQFISPDRKGQVAMVKDLMRKDGVFVTSEKFHTSNEKVNEKKKYDHQKKYFDESQLTEDKQTIVNGMSDDMVNDVAYLKVLQGEFKHVQEYWNAGKQADIFSITPLLQHSITSFRVLKVMGDIR